MLTYTPPHRKKNRKPDEKPWVLLFLAFVWLWPGIVAHDLWRPGEPVVYAAMQSVQQGQVIAPQIAGMWFVPHSPVYLWLASLFQAIFVPLGVAAYTAARLATVALMALALTAAGAAGRQLLGKYHGRSVVLVLIGCPGIMIFGHELGATAMQFAAACFFACGAALAPRKAAWGGLLLGTGFLAAFWAGNLPPVLLAAVIALLLPLHPYWRTRRYLLAAVGAAAIVLPIMPTWPYFLAKLHPQAFAQWQENALWVSGSLKDFSVAEDLLWYALPAWPLAVWTLYKREVFRQPAGFFCVLWLVVAAAFLPVLGTFGQNALLWLLPPLGILSAASLDSLRRGAAAFLNWFGIMLFGALAAAIWLAFFAVNYGFPAALARYAHSVNPHFTPHWNYFPMLVAAAFIPLWLWAVTRKNIRGRQAVTNWAAGMTLAWTLLLSLFLPWLDSRKSDAAYVAAMYRALPEETLARLENGSECIASPSTYLIAAWQEYGGIALQRAPADCRYFLNILSAAALADNRDPIVWIGSRNTDSGEYFILRETSLFTVPERKMQK